MIVYVASNIPTSYPYKLQKPATIDSTVRATATESFIMDSGIGDDTTNEQVLDLAHEHDADYVIAKDYLHDRERTTESVREFLDLYPEHPCEATPMIPLQPPHYFHYEDLKGFDHYVLGGMAGEEFPDHHVVHEVKSFRRVEPDAYVHLLGVGGGRNLVRMLAGRGLIDSLDCSTPELAAKSGKVLDAQLRQQEVRIYNGEGSSKRTHPLADFNSWQVADAWERQADEFGLQTELPTRAPVAADGGTVDAEGRGGAE